MPRLVQLLTLAFLGGCASHDEVARVPSPDRALDAVLVESNGGASTSFWYDVYVVSSGSDLEWSPSVMDFYGAIRSEEAYGVNLRWADSSNLYVEFLRAKKVSSTSSRIFRGRRIVRVVVHEGKTDTKAPPGGMLYNLQGRPYDRRS